MLDDSIAALRGVKSGLRHMARGKGALNSLFFVLAGPFFQWQEKARGDSGAPNYLTSPGGWLQATWAGYGGLRLNASTLLLKNASAPPGASSMTMRGVRFRGNQMDITSGGGSLSVTLRPVPPSPVFVPGLPHVVVIELRQAFSSYQDYHMVWWSS